MIRATAVALEMETGLSPASQRDVMVRLSRFGVSEEDLWKIAAGSVECSPGNHDKRESFFCALRSWAADPHAVARMAAALHVVDEAGWGLISGMDAWRTIDLIIGSHDRHGFSSCDNESLLHAVCVGVVDEIERSMP